MSMKHKMRSSVIQTLKYNKEGSYRTQADRHHSLIAMIESLYGLGYKLDHVQFMKPKHLYALVNLWKADNISAGVIKNRMSHVRWLMSKFGGKINMVPSNDELGIAKRVYTTNQDKSRDLTEGDLSRIKDPLMRLSLEGQKLFGLRGEESLKIQPHIADKGNFLHLHKTKGNRERLIPILSEEQRAWVDKAKQLVDKSQSLIPAGTSYKTYKSRFDKACERADIRHRHGLRHAYAQQRYKELTGWDCPAKGGLTRAQMTYEQKQRDYAARLQVSHYLGHGRINITNSYLSR
ncbi:MAG: integrase domain-containing protein [Gammaproteobacteria bacterium]|nr:integrase domain-containing protein [Gammaproteobacteria bacterium]